MGHVMYAYYPPFPCLNPKVAGSCGQKKTMTPSTVKYSGHVKGKHHCFHKYKHEKVKCSRPIRLINSRNNAEKL